jgi:hypothetical protein
MFVVSSDQMRRVGLFNHVPNPEKTIGNIVNGAGANNEEGEYGVYMNEFKDLVDEEDYFDAADEDGPDPVIEEILPGHVPYCYIPMDIDDSCLDADVRDTREKDYVKQKRVEEEEGREYDSGDEYDVVHDETDIKKRKARSNIREGQRCFAVNQAAFNMFRPGYTIVLYGPRRSGKSVMIRNICQRMRHYFPEVIVFTMTKSSAEYFNFIPYARVIEGLDEALLERLIDHQMELKKAMSRGEDVGNPNLLVILDDCMAQGLRYAKTLNRLFYNGRHSNITLIVSVQDVRGIAPSATINTDIAITFSLPDHRGRDTVREKFCDYLTRNEFDRLYDSDNINKKYHMVFFDIAHRYNSIDKRISFGCVDTDREEPFVMGCREMWTSSAESRRQLEDLGFGYLLDLDDWGIVKPDHADHKATHKRFKKTKNARKGPASMPAGDDSIKNPEKNPPPSGKNYKK